MFGMDLPTHPVLTYMVPGILACALEHGYPFLTYGVLPTILAAGSCWLEEKYNINLRLDLVSLEFQYYPAKYPNDLRVVADPQQALPIPFAPAPGSGEDYIPQWKWSLYATKSLTDNLSLVGLIGRDYAEPNTNGTQYNQTEAGDFLQQTKSFWWQVRLKVVF